MINACVLKANQCQINNLKQETLDTSFDGYKPIIDTIELKVQIYIQIIKIMIA